MMAMLGIAVCITMQKIVTEIHHLNNLKEKEYMIISLDKKVFDKYNDHSQ